MSKFKENVNAYLQGMNIKQKFISLKSDIDEKKLSRILNGPQVITEEDMEKISRALGKKTEFFLSDNFKIPKVETSAFNQVAFYAGEPTKSQEEFAMKLVELIENADEILMARNRFMSAIGDD